MNATQSRNRVREFLPNNWGEVDQLLNQVLGQKQLHFSRNGYAQASLWEDESGYHFELDLPGVGREQVEITFDKGELKVAAQRPEPEGGRTTLVDERSYGDVQRSVNLPESVDPESIDAKLTDGVLHVYVAKKPEAQPKRIEIQ